MRKEKNLTVFFPHSQIASCNTERTNYLITAAVPVKRGRLALLPWRDRFCVYALWEQEALEEGGLC